MPTYQYRCTGCGQTFERYQSFSDDPITVCPLPCTESACPNKASGDTDATCGAEVRKIFSNVGISFKGSGFYRNDSRAAASSSSGSSSGSGDSSSDSASESSGNSANDSPNSSSGSSAGSSKGSASASSDSNSKNGKSRSTEKAASASG